MAGVDAFTSLTGTAPQTVGLPNGDLFVAGSLNQSSEFTVEFRDIDSIIFSVAQPQLNFSTVLSYITSIENFYSVSVLSATKVIHAYCFSYISGGNFHYLGIRSTPFNSSSVTISKVASFSLSPYAANAPCGVATADFKKLSTDTTGSSLVAWTQYATTESTASEIYGSFVDSATSQAGTPFLIPISSGGIQDQPDLTLTRDNQFAAVWSGVAQTDAAGTDRDVFLRIVNPASPRSTPEIRVNGKQSGEQAFPAVAAFGTPSAPKLAVVWQSASPSATNPSVAVDAVEADATTSISARIYTGTGDPVTGEIAIDKGTSDATMPEAIGVDDTTFAVAWAFSPVDQTGELLPTRINVDLYKANGSSPGGYLFTTPDFGSSVTKPSLGLLADGRFALSWEIKGSKRIMTQVFDTRTTGKIIKGSSQNDALLGSEFNDKIFGYAGDDRLYGEYGDDILNGGPGTNLLDGGPGYNTASYTGATSKVTANLMNQSGSWGVGNVDTFGGIQGLIGSSYDDTLTGDPFDNVIAGGPGDDKLYGVVGDDTLQPGTGTDLVDGGDGSDTVSYHGIGKGVTVDLGFPARNLGEAAGDTYVGIENVGGTDSADDLSGNALANTLFGYLGADTLDGRGGKDLLIGGPGADGLTGGPGQDVFRMANPSHGSDTVQDFSVVDDLLQFSKAGFGGTLTVGTLPAAALVKGPNPLPATTATTFLYNTGTGVLLVDLDGTGPAAKTELLTLVGIPDITAADIQIY